MSFKWDVWGVKKWYSFHVIVNMVVNVKNKAGYAYLVLFVVVMKEIDIYHEEHFVILENC